MVPSLVNSARSESINILLPSYIHINKHNIHRNSCFQMLVHWDANVWHVLKERRLISMQEKLTAQRSNTAIPETR